MQNATLSVVAALALATAAALPVQAQQTQQGDKPEVVAKAFTAEVTGQVESVDARTGTLRLQTVDGPMTIRFPPAAVQGITKRDPVTVAFGIVKPAPSASPQTSPGAGSSSPGSGSPQTTPGTK